MRSTFFPTKKQNENVNWMFSKLKNTNLRSFFSISSACIAAMRRLANALTSTKSVCMVICGFSCGIRLVEFVTHIMQTLNTGVVGGWLGGTTIFWSWLVVTAGDEGVNSIEWYCFFRKSEWNYFEIDPTAGTVRCTGSTSCS